MPIADSRDRIANFDEKTNHPAAWWHIGLNLLHSSEILAERLTLDEHGPDASADQHDDFREDSRVRGATLMLRGCAVECFLKALYLMTWEVLSKEGEYRNPKGTKSHNLLDLAQAAKITVSPTERTLLKILGYWIEQGRYPSMGTWLKELGLSPSDEPLPLNWNATAERLWHGLTARLQKEYGDRYVNSAFESVP